jgi:hypothetical protein
MPTTSPSIPVVRITRTMPSATCITLMFRPAVCPHCVSRGSDTVWDRDKYSYVSSINFFGHFYSFVCN